MNFIDDCDSSKGKYCIIEEHDMEVLEGVEDLEGVEGLEGLEGLDSVEIIDTAHDTVVTALGDLGTLDILDTLGELNEVELIETLEGCSEHEMLQKREINQNSYEKEKPLTAGVNINVKFSEVEVTINTSTVEEVIFKKHRVEIINKRSRACIMEGVVTGYQLIGRVYDPDIVLEFEDGRTFYNENFGYSMIFYI
jgi:hypothetical protein